LLSQDCAIAVEIKHEVIRATKVHASSLPPVYSSNYLLDSDKHWQKLSLTWIKFRIVAHELSSMLDCLS